MTQRYTIDGMTIEIKPSSLGVYRVSAPDTPGTYLGWICYQSYSRHYQSFTDANRLLRPADSLEGCAERFREWLDKS